MSYLEFEYRITEELQKRFYASDSSDETIRKEILSLRKKCRDFWVSIGREVPPEIRFL